MTRQTVRAELHGGPFDRRSLDAVVAFARFLVLEHPNRKGVPVRYERSGVLSRDQDGYPTGYRYTFVEGEQP